MVRAGRYSELSSVNTTITKPYCNYDNYEYTILVLRNVGTNVTVISVITNPRCSYDNYEPPDPGRIGDLGLYTAHKGI